LPVFNAKSKPGRRERARRFQSLAEWAGGRSPDGKRGVLGLASRAPVGGNPSQDSESLQTIQTKPFRSAVRDDLFDTPA